MAQSPATLLVLSSIMAISSFLAGILPLSFSLSQRQLRAVTALGSGILIGTALIVIIPEGIETLYADHEEARHSTKESKEHGHEESKHGIVGITLVLGFVLMYLIDVLPPLLGRRSNIGSIPLSSGDIDDVPITPHKPPSTQPHINAITIGLIVHSFADGIALGASSSMPAVGLVVFGAIMLHKAPVAFGLTAALLKDGLSKRLARTHLIIFSLAAPFGALVTWAVVNVLSNGGSPEDSAFWTGVAMLLSGGTFLYVAMHSMQPSHDHGPPEFGMQAREQKSDVVYTTLGILLPLITQIGHSHAH